MSRIERRPLPMAAGNEVPNTAGPQLRERPWWRRGVAGFTCRTRSRRKFGAVGGAARATPLLSVSSWAEAEEVVRHATPDNGPSR